jgi:hypothetical protein
MKALIELVAASLARHGIECPDNSTAVSELTVAVSAEPPLTTKLPEHNYRKSSQGDPAP